MAASLFLHWPHLVVDGGFDGLNRAVRANSCSVDHLRVFVYCVNQHTLNTILPVRRHCLTFWCTALCVDSSILWGTFGLKLDDRTNPHPLDSVYSGSHLLIHNSIWFCSDSNRSVLFVMYYYEWGHQLSRINTQTAAGSFRVNQILSAALTWIWLR